MALAKVVRREVVIDSRAARNAHVTIYTSSPVRSCDP